MFVLEKFEFSLKVTKFLKTRISVNHCKKIENEIKILEFFKKKKGCYRQHHNNLITKLLKI